ncbi:MAG: hypothetical protein FJZ87_01330 [Chloroflexi bacterium]|nr:hypothetical protein [Chloroflexota bacterium]
MQMLIPVRYVKSIRTFLMILGVLGVWGYRVPLWNAMSLLGSPLAVADFLQQFKIYGLLVLAFLVLAQVFLAFIPGQALVIASGYLYGVPMTITVVASSAIIGSQLAFWLARRYGRPLIYKLASPKAIDHWDRLASHLGPGFYFLTFLLPVFPSDMMCYVGGLGKVSPRGFLAANCAGRLISTTAYTLFGAYGFRPPLWFLITVVVCMVVILTSWMIYKRLHLEPRKSDATRQAFYQPSERKLTMKISLAIIRFYARAYLRLFNLRCSLLGEYPPPEGPKIIASNHPNASDAYYLPFILSETPHFLMRSILFRLPIIGSILRGAGQIEVNPQNAKAAFDDALARLERGETIVIFPQGKYSRDHNGTRAKSGAVRLSLASGAPIIPLGVYVAAENLLDMRGHFNGRLGPGLWQVAGTCYLNFGAPWQPGSEIRANASALTDELMKRIEILAEASATEGQCAARASFNSIPQT